MNSIELRGLVMAIGLTQDKLSSLIGVSPRTLRSWLQGEASVPGPAVRLLRLYADGQVTYREIEIAGEDHNETDTA